MVNQVASLSYIVENNAGKESAADFEKAIKLCGYGKFHYGLILLCGAMFLCVGCQNGINAYILPSAECDLDLSSEQKGLLNVAFLLGGVVSSLFWGVFADAYGRRYILLLTLLSDSILSIGGSFSQSFKVLLIFRALSGFFMGAPGSLIYMYLGEFHAAKHRVKAICYVGFFWTLSWLILPGLAWIIIPLPISLRFNGMLYNSWRLFLAIIGIPTLMVTLIATRYPESPKFLVTQGKTDEALTILRKIYAINTGRNEDDYPVKVLLSDDTMNIKNVNNTSFSASRVLMELLKNIWQQMRSLASPPLLKYALLCWTIYFANMCGYYGFGLWLPELFNRFESYQHSHPNRSVSVCKLIQESDLQATVTPASNISLNSTNVLINSTTETDCSSNMDEMVFINSLTINAFCLLGNIVSGYLANRVGRRTIPVTTMLLAGMFGFAIYFVESSLQILMVSCMFSLMIVTANFVISSIVVDIFPTHVGAVAICMMTCFGRIGAIASNLAFGMLLDISCEVPIFLVGGIVIFGGLLALTLPQKKS
ncbi:synaptic vesicle glycoprotein 2B-like isoform X1 [Bombus pyrosoma]|uniref:synaptic vesicle glycoprotein 2B-like isoform X1 n=1 Tax=Bombus pyrosoma TaxID=396416 RepID=UPI001CB92970|nr:synaptic vesicle glycoprotein 2B-like isoform X1 [Bombus pyrosoma]